MKNIKNNEEKTLKNKIESIIEDLRYTNKFRQKHESSIQDLISAIKVYFEYKHRFFCSVETEDDYFIIKPNRDYYSFNNTSMDFKFTARIIADFCDDFQCELLLFEDWTCMFKFVDSDLKNVFCGYW